MSASVAICIDTGSLRTKSLLLRNLDSLRGCLIEAVKGKDLEARVAEDLLGLLLLGALETDNKGNLELELLGRLDDTLGDDVAAHDTTEDVHKDRLDVLAREDNLKRLLHSGRVGAATDIEEVGGLATVESKHVEGSHGETGTVHKAANVAIESDEVEAVLASVNLGGVLLRDIAELEHVLLTEVRVVVKAELGIHAEHSTVGGFGHGVDLDLGGVLLLEELVQLDEDVSRSLLLGGAREANLLGDLKRGILGETFLEVDLGGHDRVGVLLGNLLNRGTALVRRDDHRKLRNAVVEDSNVVLVRGSTGLGDHHAVAQTATSTSLLRDELGANHLARELTRLLGGLDQVHTTLEAIVKVALTTATSKHLRLDHHRLAVERLGGVECLLSGSRRDRLGRVNAVLVKQVDREVLVDRQEALLHAHSGCAAQRAARNSGMRAEQVDSTEHAHRYWWLFGVIGPSTPADLAGRHVCYACAKIHLAYFMGASKLRMGGSGAAAPAEKRKREVQRKPPADTDEFDIDADAADEDEEEEDEDDEEENGDDEEELEADDDEDEDDDEHEKGPSAPGTSKKTTSAFVLTERRRRAVSPTAFGEAMEELLGGKPSAGPAILSQAPRVRKSANASTLRAKAARIALQERRERQESAHVRDVIGEWGPPGVLPGTTPDPDVMQAFLEQAGAKGYERRLRKVAQRGGASLLTSCEAVQCNSRGAKHLDGRY